MNAVLQMLFSAPKSLLKNVLADLRPVATRLLTATVLAAAVAIGGVGCDGSGGTAETGAPIDDGGAVFLDPGGVETGVLDAVAGDSGGGELGEVSAPDADAAEEPPKVDLVGPVAADEVRAGVIEDAEALLGGPKADGRTGDVKIMNAEASFIIEGPGRARGGYRFNGGNVVDAMPAGVSGGDVFGEVWNTWNLHVFRPTAMEIVSDGSDGEAHVRLTGDVEVFWWAWSFLAEFLGGIPTTMDVAIDYRLAPGERALRRDVSLTNPDNKTIQLPMPLMFSSQGDGVSTWHRGVGFDFTDGSIDALILVGDNVAHAIVPVGRPLDVLIDYSDVVVITEPPVTIGPGETVTLSYRHVVVKGGAAAAEAEVAALIGDEDAIAGVLAGSVTRPDTATGAIYVVARQDGKPITMANVDPDGQFELRVPLGDYELRAFAPHHAASEIVAASATATASPISLAVTPAATVEVTVEDPDGNPVPGRVTLLATGETPRGDAPHDVFVGPKGTWAWSGYGHVNAVGYAMGGKTVLTVPAGTYHAIGSRGFSYELDEADFEVAAGEKTALTLVLERVVDTSGWIAADFHVHAMRSPDSGTPYTVRVEQAVSEDLELALLTEHVQIGNLGPTADALGLSDAVVTLPAQEITTFEYGHFNAFPLADKPEAPNRGAILPYDKQPKALFAAIRDQAPGDEIIQVNHPRGAELAAYFSWAGLDAKDLSVKKKDAWSDDFDAVEVFNGSCKDGAPLVDWIAMTNGGWGKTMAGGSDSHRENRPIGLPRNWIPLDATTLRGDPQTLVAQVRGRHVVVSCGPFVRFTTADGTAGVGDRTGVDETGEVSFRVVVEAPSWIALTEARILKNGVVTDIIPIEEAAGGVRLDAEFSDTPDADAWYAVDVIGTGNLLPINTTGPPRAITNPIEVDADGDNAWTPPGLP